MEEYELPHKEMPGKGVETADIVRLQMPLWKQVQQQLLPKDHTVYIIN